LDYTGKHCLKKCIYIEKMNVIYLYVLIWRCPIYNMKRKEQVVEYVNMMLFLEKDYISTYVNTACTENFWRMHC
jgi:hypothetical protein